MFNAGYVELPIKECKAHSQSPWDRRLPGEGLGMDRPERVPGSAQTRKTPLGWASHFIIS